MFYPPPSRKALVPAAFQTLEAQLRSLSLRNNKPIPISCAFSLLRLANHKRLWSWTPTNQDKTHAQLTIERVRAHFRSTPGVLALSTWFALLIQSEVLPYLQLGWWSLCGSELISNIGIRSIFE